MSDTPEKAPDLANVDTSIIPEESKQGAIYEIIKSFGSRIRGIKSCASDHMEIAGVKGREWADEFARRVAIIADRVKNNAANLTPQQLADNLASDFVNLLEDIETTGVSHTDILSRSLLIFGFATFDAYIGTLLTKLYREAPKLVFGLTEKKVDVSDVMRSESLEELINFIIDREINVHSRGSYEDQFETLVNRHKLKDTWNFERWPDFIEAAQRRNLITHCNGIVNSQYITACKRVGYQLPEDISGKALGVAADYLRGTLDNIYELGVILGHTLWRQAIPTAIGKSEAAMNWQIFGLLRQEEWGLAARVGKYAVEHRDPGGDFLPKLLAINYAQALKWQGKPQAALKIVNAIDWTASIRDFRLGVEVLRENYDNAATLMVQIGKSGELIRKSSYSDWPVFREFRKSQQFLAAFNEVYGEQFAPTPIGGQNGSIGSGGVSATEPPQTVAPSENQESAMPPRPIESEADDLSKDSPQSGTSGGIK